MRRGIGFRRRINGRRISRRQDLLFSLPRRGISLRGSSPRSVRAFAARINPWPDTKPGTNAGAHTRAHICQTRAVMGHPAYVRKRARVLEAFVAAAVDQDRLAGDAGGYVGGE